MKINIVVPTGYFGGIRNWKFLSFSWEIFWSPSLGIFCRFFLSLNFWSSVCCTSGHKSWAGGGDFLLDLFSTSQFVDCSYICIFIAAYIQIIRTAEGKRGGRRSEWGGLLPQSKVTLREHWVGCLKSVSWCKIPRNLSLWRPKFVTKQAQYTSTLPSQLIIKHCAFTFIFIF